jgi:hypothetical protein
MLRMQDTVAGLQRTVSGMQEAIVKMQATTAAMQRDVVAIKLEMRDMPHKEDWEGLVKDVKYLKGEVSKIAPMEAKIDNILETLAPKLEQVSDHELRIRKLEAA